MSDQCTITLCSWNRRDVLLEPVRNVVSYFKTFYYSRHLFLDSARPVRRTFDTEPTRTRTTLQEYKSPDLFSSEVSYHVRTPFVGHLVSISHVLLTPRYTRTQPLPQRHPFHSFYSFLLRTSFGTNAYTSRISDPSVATYAREYFRRSMIAPRQVISVTTKLWNCFDAITSGPAFAPTANDSYHNAYSARETSLPDTDLMVFCNPF